MHLSVPPLACPHACNPRSLGTRRSATSLDHCSPRFFSRFVLCIRTTVTTHAYMYYGYRCKCTRNVCVHARTTRDSMARSFHEGGRTSLFDPGTIMPPESMPPLCKVVNCLRSCPRVHVTLPPESDRIAFVTS